MSIEENKKAAEARRFIDSICEDEERSHDFVCRLRNAMLGVDYKEGCPGLDYIFTLIVSNEFETSHADKKTNTQSFVQNLKNAVDADPDGFSRAIAILQTNQGNFLSLMSDDSREPVNQVALKALGAEDLDD